MTLTGMESPSSCPDFHEYCTLSCHAPDVFPVSQHAILVCSFKFKMMAANLAFMHFCSNSTRCIIISASGICSAAARA